MICPNCGAYVEQELVNCPHCQTSLSGNKVKPTGSKTWFKGCSVCGCSCLVVVLIVLGIIAFATFQVWKVIEQQLDTEPIEVEEIYLDEAVKNQLDDTFASIDAAKDSGEEKTFILSFTEDELNYLIQLVFKNNREFFDQVRMSVHILEDNWLDCDYSYKISDQKYLNGAFTCFVKVEEENIEFRLRTFRFGDFEIQPEEIREVNQFFTADNLNGYLADLNTSNHEEFAFVIESLSIDNQKLTLVIKTKNR